MTTKIYVGISGTQHGMTEKQAIALIYLFSQIQDQTAQYYHGDCIGVDAEFHDLVRKMHPEGVIVICPPDNDSKRAFCKGDVIRKSKPYLERNKDIVSLSNLMFIVPKEKEEQLRGSGTWASFRYAQKTNKPIILIYPDGKYKKITNAT